MKLKAIGAILNRVKQMVLLDAGSSQWIGDGCAFYLLPESIGQLNVKTACMIFDIPEDKAANWRIKRQEMPEVYDVTDDGDEDEEIVTYDTFNRVMFKGYDLMPATTPSGKTFFLQARYMKPLTDADPVITLRYTRAGTPYYVAKAGMFAEAIIMPTVPSPDLAEWMTTITEGTARARYTVQREIGTDEADDV